MIVSVCQHTSRQKHGKDRQGNQRFKCSLCGKTFVETVKPLGTMRVDMKDATMALGMLLEGLSLRAVSRLTGLDRGTLDNLILTVGANCEALMNSIKGVECKDVECDEIWSFIGMKEKTRQARGYSAEYGDSWTWIAVEANTKLVIAYKVGERDSETCWSFIGRLRDATVGRFQVSTDGLSSYKKAIPFLLRDRVDFGQLIKEYASSQTETRYSPATIISAERKAQWGNPEMERICTSRVETLNQKLRMHLRRFTRLTNAHSKSYKQHRAMQAIFFAFYNWVRRHETIKTTPAVAAGIADREWTLRELLERAAA